METRVRLVSTLLAVTITVLCASVVYAQNFFLEKAPDGAILIFQETSLGFALPGDAPGFPITISQPGSYRLASNIVVPDASITAVEISANNVNLDLNGFVISGPASCLQGNPFICSPSTGTGVGVSAVSLSPKQVTIQNGAVKGFSTGVTVSGGRVERIHASNNLVQGIRASDSVVLYNTAILNGVNGINALRSVLIGNVATQNGNLGIQSDNSNGAAHNVINSNGTDSLVATDTAGNVCTFAICP